MPITLMRKWMNDSTLDWMMQARPDDSKLPEKFLIDAFSTSINIY